MRAGVPSIASHILSNHYNNTRTEYYRQLQNATETGNLSAFILYALEGFRDGLKNTITVIHQEQTEQTWNNYVHDKIEEMRSEGKSQKTLQRLKQLAYSIPGEKYLAIDEIAILNPRIAADYRRLSSLTLRRDLELLTKKDILKTEKNKYRANLQLLYSFLPATSAPIKQHF